MSALQRVQISLATTIPMPPAMSYFLNLNIGELLSGAAHGEASVVEFFNRPGSWEATRLGHGLRSTTAAPIGSFGVHL